MNIHRKFEKTRKVEFERSFKVFENYIAREMSSMSKGRKAACTLKEGMQSCLRTSGKMGTAVEDNSSAQLINSS